MEALATEQQIPTVAPMQITPTALLPAATVHTPELFRIEAARSQARFSVYETFPKETAIGTTNQITGDIIVDIESSNVCTNKGFDYHGVADEGTLEFGFVAVTE